MKDGDIEGKIDDLARMVADGFSEVRGELKDVRDTMSTQGDLAELRKEMATKADLVHLRGDIDIMLDKHIGIFRKDFDELAARVKRLEQLVLK
jgi:polyhydroxyalkanoate synthesis regulator phasin